MPQALARILPSFFVHAAKLMRTRRDTPIPVAPHGLRRIRVIDITNQASLALPAPVRVSRMPAAAANADPADQADVPRAPGPDENALGILTGQIHALLDQARTEAPAAFGTKLDALALDPKAPLDSRQASQLLRVVKTLPTTTPVRTHAPAAERLKVLRSALYDLTRAARAEAMLHEQIARHTERERVNELPGSQRSTGTGGMLGVRFGLPGAVDAGVAGGARTETSTATFDDLTIGTVRSATVMAEASAQAKVGPGVGITGTLSGYSTEGDADISMSMRTRVLRLAHASVARRLGGNVLQRAYQRVTEPHRDRYDERTSRAMAWQSRLPMLMGVRAGAQPLAFGKRGILIKAGMTTHGGAVTAAAGYGVGQLSATGAMSRLELRAALPTRLTELDAEGRPAAQDASIRSVLDARVSHRVSSVLDRDPTGKAAPVPVMQTVRLLMQHPRHPDGLAQRLNAVAQMRAAFEHLESLTALSLRSPELARAPLASLARDWGSTGTTCEPVMIAMLDTLAWLQAAPEPDPGPAHAQWTALQRTVQADARRIHDTPLPHDREWIDRATQAFREQIQRIATTRGTLSLSAALPLLNIGGTVDVARHVRQDPDPWRDGKYLEVTVAASLGPALGSILAEVERQVPEWGALPLREVEALIDPVTASLDVSGEATWLLRFFEPTYQKDRDFPASARGNHVHLTRLTTGTKKEIGFTVPVPVGPGVFPTLSAKHTRAEQTTRDEHLGADSLSSAMMRYLSKCSATTPREETWAALLETHGADLDRLAGRLTDPDSVPALEARYWLQREPTAHTGGATTRRAVPDTSTLDAFSREADRSTRRELLFHLFEALGGITSQQKSKSDLIGALTLPVVG